MSLDENPYRSPTVNDSNSEMEDRSFVRFSTWLGALAGMGFGVLIQFVAFGAPYSKDAFDGHNSMIVKRSEIYSLLLWSTIFGLLFAILGSIVGALLDTYYASLRAEVDEQDLQNQS